MSWVRRLAVSPWGTNGVTFVVALALALPLSIGLNRPSGPARITVLPTADAVTYLIEDGDGRRIIVGGGASDGALRAFSERTRPWDRRLDLLVLPPPFRDHLPGATDIVRRTQTGRVIELGGPGTKPSDRYDPWQLATLDRGHIPERLWGHLSIPLARGVTLDLIATGHAGRRPPPAPHESAQTREQHADAPARREPGGECRSRWLSPTDKRHDEHPPRLRRAGRDPPRFRAADRPDAPRRPGDNGTPDAERICAAVGARRHRLRCRDGHRRAACTDTHRAAGARLHDAA